MPDSLPYGRHWVDDDDVAAVTRVLREGWLTQGPVVEAFEQAFAERCGAAHAVAVGSGSAALHLALLAAGIHEGDEIVGPAITFLATANAGVHVGATPRFVDAAPPSALMTPSLLEPVLSRRTRAVLPVHFAGEPCDMPALSALVRERCPEAVIVEDACHALGAEHAEGTPVGAPTWSDMVAFSFHPVKHVATGEGGLVLTDRDDLADRLRMLRSHGTTKDPVRMTRPYEGPWHYEMLMLGFNARMPDLNAALGLSQLGKLDRFVARRREIAARYHRELADLPGCVLPGPEDPARSSWHLYPLQLEFDRIGKSREKLVIELRDRGIGTQVHYPPVPLQPFYRERFGYREGQFPGAERFYARALTIPLFPAMSDEDVDRVVDALHEALET
jgi:perosamine synthetase